MITESGGFSDVRRLTGNSADRQRRQLRRARSADGPDVATCGSPCRRPPAARSRRARPVGGDPFGDTVYVCTTSAAVCATSAGYFHTVYDELGVAHLVPNRAAVLLFTATNWQTPQTVWFAAANDTLPQGDHRHGDQPLRDQRRRRVFAGAVVRNVEVTVHDNLTPGVVVTQRDGPPSPDTDTDGHQGHADDAADRHLHHRAASPPSGTVTYVLTPSDSRIQLSSDDLRFSLGAVVGGVQTYRITICVVCTNGESAWNVPVLVTVTAVDNFLVQDPHHTIVVDHGRRRPRRAATRPTTASRARSTCSCSTTTRPASTSSRAAARRSSACPTAPPRAPPTRMPCGCSSAPKAAVSIGIVTDGQTSIVTDPTCGAGILGKVCLAAVGRLAAKELFRGNVTISGATLTRAAGSELGSFLLDGFRAGQKLLVTGAGGSSNTIATAYTIVAVTASAITLSAALPAGGTFAGVSLQRVPPAGLFTGAVTWDAGTKVLTRNDGTSWLDNGFLEGQLVRFTGVTGTFKIQSIFGARLEKMSFTVAPVLASGTVTLTAVRRRRHLRRDELVGAGHGHRRGRRRLPAARRPRRPHRLPEAAAPALRHPRPAPGRRRHRAAAPQPHLGRHRCPTRSTRRPSASASSRRRHARSTCSTSSTTAAARTSRAS